MTEAPALRIGTSGWVYRHWLGEFYPAGTPGEKQLALYAEQFDTVEVNYSYYRLPERSVFEGWRNRSPEGFLFAVKGSRYLTHMKKLKDPQEPLERLMARAGGLEAKLGPILFQFPHTWPQDIERLRTFLTALAAWPGQRFTLEFRHASWLVPEVYRLLEDAGAALCMPVHPQMPLDARLTANWTYLRFHGGQGGIGFTEGELEAWAGRIRAFRDARADVYAYFNNDIGGHAPRDARRLRAMLQS